MQRLPAWVDINLDNLVFNLTSIKRHVGSSVRILLTVKADAYGHGAVQVALAAADLVDMFGVATIDEAIELKQAGIEGSRILLLSPVLEKEIQIVVESGFTVTVSAYSFAVLLSKKASQNGTRVPVHIEVDTGMGRTGVLAGCAESEIIRLAALPGIEIGGVYTHFPSSDEDPDFTRAQIEQFMLLMGKLREKGVEIPLFHSANSCAATRFRDSHMDMIRPGLLAYGHLPDGSQGPVAARPVMKWKSRLVQVRQLPKGSSISYGRSFTTKRETLVGVVPIGYGHGYPFRVSNRGQMLTCGKRVPILGRVTMDMTMVDLTDLGKEPALGEEVVLFGGQGESRITLHELASWADTIPYEILCGISKRVPRTYLRNGKVETYKSLLGVMAKHLCP